MRGDIFVFFVTGTCNAGFGLGPEGKAGATVAGVICVVRDGRMVSMESMGLEMGLFRLSAANGLVYG